MSSFNASNRPFPTARRTLRVALCTAALGAAALLGRRVLLAADSDAPAASADVESFDGTGNNLAHPTWGSAPTDLIRLAHPAYADGIDAPARPGDQSARVISNILNNQADPTGPSLDIQTVDQNSLSDFGYAFGQFMDHDMDNTPDGGASFPIAVAPGDPIGPDPLPFTRSLTDPATGTSNPAQQLQVVTSYFDLSQVYGSSQDVAQALRTFQGGLLKSSPGNMLPYDNTTYFTADQIAALNMANDSQALPESSLFAAGDVRANENIELTTIETLFMRNHNRLAAQFQGKHPNWTDEQLYQEARKLNIAVYQHVIYSEWIPAVLGQNALPPYCGYDRTVNATVANEFSTVAYRFGHSLVSPTIARDGNNGEGIEDVIPLAVDFFDPNLLNPSGIVDPLTGLVSTDIGPILKGEADGNGQEMDLLAVSPIRNLLFGNGIIGGQDLIALDVQRSRDHGIPDYNTLRKAMGLPAVTSVAQITRNEKAQVELMAAYPGGVNTIDPFEGGLAEDHVRGSDVGPLFQAVMVNQFKRLRDGDRFFYLNENFDSEENEFFQQENSLAKIIGANTDVTNLQSDVIYFKASISGTVRLAKGRGAAGVTVQLEDTTGDILGDTTTSRDGTYSFDQLSGPSADPGNTPGVSATGSYVIVLDTPDQQASAPIPITHGDTAVTGVDFTID